MLNEVEDGVEIGKRMNKNIKMQIPNIITVIRLIFSFVLFLVKPQTVSFFLIYIICGITDVVDGYLARKWKVSSKQGAMLDSVADLVFMVVLLIIFIPILKWKRWMLIWIGIIAVIRCLSVLIGAYKYHTAAFIHTDANKLTGLLVFCFPVLLKVLGINIIVMVICVVAVMAAVEELVIMVTTEVLDRDQRRL